MKTITFLKTMLTQTRLSKVLTVLALLSTGQAQALMGGNRSVGYPATVRMDFTKDGDESVCSGVLISNRYILTAAQCFGVLGPKSFTCSPLQAEMDVRNIEVNARSYSIKGIHIHPDVAGTTYSVVARPLLQKWDLAVVELNEPVQGMSGNVLRFAHLTSEQPVIVGGYGMDRIAGAYSPALLMTTGKLTAANPTKMIVETRPETSLLHGDVGGPVYDMEGQVVAINSSIIPSRFERRIASEADTETPVAYTTYATRLTGQHEWINQVAQGHSTATCVP